MRSVLRHARGLWLIPTFALMLSLHAALLKPTSTPTNAAPLTTPTCFTHTTAMTLSVSNALPQVGDVLVVTSTLANAGCGNVGLPEYRLHIQAHPPVLLPESPPPISHTLSIAPGQSDSAEFTLHVVGDGPVTLTASSSFEVHLGYPGPAYWSGDTSAPLTLTVPPTDTEVSVLYQAAYEVGCASDVTVAGTTYRFVCIPAAGHVVNAQMQRFTDAATALATFEQARGTLTLGSFHGYPAYTWAYEEEAPPRRQQGHSWVADRWIITSESEDDVGLPVPPSPLTLSEAIYDAALTRRLFAARYAVYLPLVLRRP